MKRAAFIFSLLAFLLLTPPAKPGAFSKLGPGDQSAGLPLHLSLSWSQSSGAVKYEVCLSPNDPPICNGPWLAAGAATSLELTNLNSGTTYFWQARAVGEDGTFTYADGPTAFWRFTTATAPSMFVKIAPYDGQGGVSTSPNLSWGASSGALQYEYCYDQSNDHTCAAWVNVGLQRSVALDGLITGASYYWQVRASGVGGTTYANTGPEEYWRFTTQSTPPGPFNKTSPVDQAGNLALPPVIAWEASSGVEEYKYCVDESDDDQCATWVSSGAERSAALANLSLGKTYYWQVQAVSPGGNTYANGSALDFWSFSTRLAPPAAFALQSPPDGATGLPTTLNLSWEASQGASYYEYCYDTSDDEACSVWINTGSETQAGLSELIQGADYFWQARATGPGGTTYAGGVLAAFHRFTTLPAPPGAFQKTAPADQSTGLPINPRLRWNASAGASRYEYCYAPSPTCTAWIDAGTALQADLGGLDPATLYTWQVRAIGPGGATYADGDPSAIWRFTTLPAPLDGSFGKSTPANAASGLATSLQVSWQPSAGAAAYAYCYDATNDGQCASWIEAGTALSATLTGLNQATTYYWQARAAGPAGTVYANGNPAAFWHFTTALSSANQPYLFLPIIRLP